jgi:hypothetical protein
MGSWMGSIVCTSEYYLNNLLCVSRASVYFVMREMRTYVF